MYFDYNVFIKIRTKLSENHKRTNRKSGYKAKILWFYKGKQKRKIDDDYQKITKP